MQLPNTFSGWGTSKWRNRVARLR